ncbi:unnamed protein product [Amoebophrya sp. A120]|nr:unnamed protein product [Amoebophrya sp. A120]|eukprot:GSA120T00011520001.1
MLPSVLHQAPPARFQKLVQAVEQLAPPSLAEGWDNVGLLLDCLDETRWSESSFKPRIFLCNDLTERVAEEAITKKVDCVVTYHPTPFAKFRTVTRTTHIGRVVLSMITNRIPVYATHTCLDCVNNGLNDWLINAFPNVGEILPCNPLDAKRPNLGSGRVGSLPMAITIDDAVGHVKTLTGLKHVRRADPVDGSQKPIRRVAVCAGSGGSVFKDYMSKNPGSVPDLFLTGEMSHHDVLELNQNGAFVILTEHSNSERPFLPVFRERLLGLYPDAEVVISEIDADPLFVA